ncbi:STIP1 y and U box-containing protein 1, partial [Kappamyces sp. JEL0680]
KQIVVEHVKRLREQGNDWFRKTDYVQAIECYSRAIHTSTDPPEDLEPLRKTDNPFSFLDRLLRPLPIPVEPGLFVNRALCRIKLGMIEEALEDCRQALAVDPIHVKAQYRESQCLRSLERYPEALQSLTKCMQLLENNSDNQAQVSIAVVREQLVQLQSIIEDQEIASQEAHTLKQDPMYQAMHRLLAALSEAQEKKEQPTFKSVGISLIRLLETHSSMQHSFRLLGGFSAIAKDGAESVTWARIISAACKHHETNCRHLLEKMERFLAIAMAVKNDEAFGVFVELIATEPPLRLAFCRPFLSLDFGRKLQQGFRCYTPACQKALVSWFADLGHDLTFQYLSQKGITTEWLIQCTTSQFLPNPEAAVVMLFYMTLEPACHGALKAEASSLVSHLVACARSKALQTDVMLSNVHSTIHNLVPMLDEKAVDASMLSQTAEILVDATTKYPVSLKTLAKLSRFFILDTVQVLCSRLDWSRAVQDLRQPLADSHDTAADWTQVLAKCLKISPDLCSQLQEALPVLVQVLKNTLDGSKQFARIIGNASLCLIEFSADGNPVSANR